MDIEKNTKDEIKEYILELFDTKVPYIIQMKVDNCIKERLEDEIKIEVKKELIRLLTLTKNSL